MLNTAICRRCWTEGVSDVFRRIGFYHPACVDEQDRLSKQGFDQELAESGRIRCLYAHKKRSRSPRACPPRGCSYAMEQTMWADTQRIERHTVNRTR